VPAFLSREGLALAIYDRIVAAESGKKSIPKGCPGKRPSLCSARFSTPWKPQKIANPDPWHILPTGH